MKWVSDTKQAASETLSRAICWDVLSQNETFLARLRLLVVLAPHCAVYRVEKLLKDTLAACDT